nr:integrase, catalytic region, zinc finger, CCHC-type, peptidase aspartic, catalytic [Tanacetum cinerariifolium]
MRCWGEWFGRVLVRRGYTVTAVGDEGTKDETPEVIKNFLKKISVRLQALVIIVRTDNETEFKNHVLKEYFDSVVITHETSAAKTPQQNENDREDIDKLGAKGDIGFFIGYSANFIAYRVYNRRTRKIMEIINVTFDELSVMAFKQNSSRPGLQKDKPFELEFMPFLVMIEDCETVIGFILELALTVLGTFLASLETLSGLILNIPGAITLSLFTPLDTGGLETELEVTGFDKAFVSLILGRISAIGCFANLVFLLKS